MVRLVHAAPLALALGIGSLARAEAPAAPPATHSQGGARDGGACAEESALRAELEKGRGEAAASREASDRLRSEVSTLRSEVSSLHGELDRLRGTGSVSDLARELDRLRDAANDLRNEMAKLARALENARR